MLLSKKRDDRRSSERNGKTIRFLSKTQRKKSANIAAVFFHLRQKYRCSDKNTLLKMTEILQIYGS